MKRVSTRHRRALASRPSAPVRRARPLGVSLARFTSAAAMCGALVAGVGSAKAANTYYWDADGSLVGNSLTGFGLGGSGVWNTSALNWWDTTANVAWPNAVAGDIAVFSGTPGVIQLGGNITVGGLTFNSAGYNIVDGTAGSRLTLTGAGAIQTSVVGTNTISTGIDGSSGLTLTGTGLTSVLSLTSLANAYTGTNTINSATLNITGDGSLGNAANGLTFSPGVLGGLTIAQSTSLGAGRLVTVGTGATATLTSTANAGINVLGQVTGAGNLTMVNSGVTGLLSTANDLSGTIWAQNGTVALNSLTDAAGSGNIKLGNGGSTGGLLWASGAGTALNLVNRAVEMAGTTGGLSIDSSATLAANTVTINTLLITGNGNKTLTLTGSNAGTNVFNADIVDGTGTTAFTKTGNALWVLTGNNTFTGNVSIGAGTTRVLSNNLGTGAGTLSFSSGSSSNLTLLEFRNENSINFAKNITSNAGTNETIYLDRGLGGTGVGKTMTLGTVTQANSSANFSFVGDHGYGMTLGQSILNHSGTPATGTSFVYTNDLGSPGYTAPGFSNGVLTLGGFTTDAIANAGTGQVLQGWGDYVINGPITSPLGAALVLNITKSGVGILTIPGATGTGTGNGWTNGTLSLSAGTTRLTTADTIGTGGATLTLSGGLLELRSDSSLNFDTNIGGVSGTTGVVLVDHAIGSGSAGNTLTLGTLAANNTATISVIGDRDYSLSLGLITVTGGKTFTLNNYLAAPGYGGPGYTPGLINLSGISADNTATAATIVLAGLGDYSAFNGAGGTNPISSPNAGTPLNITKSALGVANFSGDNSLWTAGTLTNGGGTTVIDATNLNAVGAANLAATGGLLEIRSATGTSGAIWTGKSLTAGNATVTIDPLAGSGITGQTVNLGGVIGLASGTDTLISNHGYNLVFNAAGTAGNVTVALNNIGNGLVTYAGGLTSTAATSTWAFAGNGDVLISGNILDGAGKTGISKNGLGTLTLSGVANNFTGNITLTAGVLKITTAVPGTGTLAFNNTASSPTNLVTGLDLRNNTGIDLSTHPLGGAINMVINADNNGAGANGTMTFGNGLSFQNNGWNLLATAANGYSLKFGSVNMSTTTGGIGYTIFNYIPSIGGNGNLELGNITFVNTASTGTLALSGTGDFLFSGGLTYTAGGTADTINKNGLGTLTISADLSSSWNNANAIMMVTNGILRPTTSNSLGGASAKVNLNSGVLDLRSNSALTLLPTITVGATNSFINVDRAVNGIGTGATDTLGGVNLGAFTLFTTGGSQSGANAYSLNTGAVNLTATGAVIVNNVGNGGTLTIPSLTGTATSVTFSGSGATKISAATITTGSITKSGTGTVTLTEPGVDNTTGNLAINAGTLVADYSAGVANAILTTTSTLGLSGGTLQIKGAMDGTTTMQTLAAVTLNAGGSGITLTPQGGGTTGLTTGTLTATAPGGTLLVNAPANTTLRLGAGAFNTAASIGRIVFFDGANYNWATNAGANTDLTSMQGAAYTYTDIAGTPFAGSTNNDRISTVNANEITTLSASSAVNSLMINAQASGQSLDLNGNNLTLTNGGLLFTGGNNYDIVSESATQGLKGPVTGDLIIQQYGTGTLNIKAPILSAGSSSLTIAGFGTVALGSTTLGANLNTYTGTTFINGGTLQIVDATQLGANAATNALTMSGGTLDINGNNFGIAGAVTAGYAGTIDNTGSAATLTVGGTSSVVTILGTIKNTGGALSITKIGTGALTLGDVNGMSSLAFTGDLSIASNSTVNVAVPLMDTVGRKINLGSPGSAEVQTFNYVGNTNLVLNNRQIDLNGASSAIINGNGVNGLNGTQGMVVINTNLLLSGAGDKTLTLGGTSGVVGTAGGAFVSGLSGSDTVATINTFAGTIGVNNPNGITLGLALTGSASWALTGANVFTGGVTMNSTGVLRGSVGNGAASGSFGGSGNTITWSAAGTLDLRSETDQNFGNPIAWGNAALKINVDRAPGGDGYAKVMTLGTITETTSGQTLTVTNALGVGSQNNGTNPIGAYGLRIAGFVLSNGPGTISNAIGGGAAAYFATPASGTGVAGALVIDGITTGVSPGPQSLSIGSGGNAPSVTIVTGEIAQTPGSTLALTFSGINLLTLSGQTAASNYGGGLTVNTTTGTVRATTTYSLGSGGVSLTNGTLELRGDTSTVWGGDFTTAGAPVAWSGANSVQLTVGESLNGTGGHGNNFTLGALTLGTGAGKALTVSGISGSTNNSGDSVTFGGVVLSGATASSNAVTNNLLLPAMLNLGDLTNTFTTTASTETLTLNGSGVTTLGNATDASSNGLTGIAYAGTGILDLTRATGTNTYTGGLTVGGGIVRVTSLNNLGGATNFIAFSGTAAATLEMRSDTGFTVLQQVNVGGSLSTISMGQLPGGTGANTYGSNFVLSGIVTPSGAAKGLIVNGIDGTTAANGDNLTINHIDFGTGGAFNTLFVTNNLLIPSMVNIGAVTNTLASTPATLTIQGTGVSTLGNVTDGVGGSTTAVVYSGTGFLNLNGDSGSNYTGGFKVTGGVARVLTPYGLGTGPLGLGGGTLEIRSDTDVSYLQPVNLTATTSVTLGQLPGGAGATGKLVTLGNISATAGTLTIAGIGGTSAANSYSVALGSFTLNGAAAGVSNLTPLPSAVTIASVTNATTGTSTFTLGGTSSLTTVTGPITNGAGVTAVTVSTAGGGVAVISGDPGTNYSGGLNFTGNGGIMRLLGLNAFGASTNVVNLSPGGTNATGTLDVRSDTNLTIPNAITVPINSVTINVDQISTGSLGKTITFNGAATTLNTTGKSLTLTSGSGYGMNFTNGFTDQVAGYTIVNNAFGPVSLGAINYTAAAGALTIGGFGTTVVGNITGTTAAAALTYNGTGTLDLTGNNGATNPISSLAITGAGSIVRVAGAASLGAANAPLTFGANGITLQVRSNGAGSNGTIAFNNPIALTAASGTYTIDVGNNGANTGNKVAFGSVSNGGAANPGTLIVNGANGYSASFGAITLPSTTGNNTTIVANVPVNITGNATNSEAGFGTGNFDTFFLDGTAGGTFSGMLIDAAGGSLTANGLARLTKQGTGTWTLSGVNTNLGINVIANGTLKLGVNNALSFIGMGTNVTAAAGSAANGVTATLDLAGFNQTFGLGTGTISGIQTAALLLGGGSPFSQPIVTDSVGTGTLTLTGAGTTGDIQYISTTTTNPLGGIVSVGTLNLGGALRGIIVGDSTSAAADLTISSAIQNGTINKSGAGNLLLSGALALPATPTTFFTLAAGSGSVVVTSPVTSTTAQTWANNSVTTTVAGSLDLAGKLNMGANALTVTGVGQTQLANTAPGAGANAINTINVTGGVIGGLSTATGAATGTVASTGGAALTGSSSLASASIALSGANPILRLAPALGTSLAGGTTPGLFAKTYQVGGTLTSLGATNFLGAGQSIATFTGGFAYLANLPTTGGTVANLPTVTASTAFPATTSAQFTGLLNITTAGLYSFSTTTDDGSILTVDGNALNSPGNSTVTGAIYLTAGLHVFNERVNNNSSNGTVSVRYQGADTAGALVDIPASAFFQASNAADLASTFTNNVTLAATTNATIDVAANTTLNGSLTMTGTGTGTTLNILGSGNGNTLTISGATVLTGDLAIVTPTANLTLGGAVSGAFGLTKSSFGTLNLGGANSYTGATTLTSGGLNLTAAGAINGSAITVNGGTLTQTAINALTGTTSLKINNAAALVDLSNSNNFSGGITLTLGTLSFGSGGLGSGNVTMATGTTLRWDTGNTQDVSTKLALTGTSTFDTNGNNVTFASPVSTASIVKTGLGALTLGGATTLTGNLVVSQGGLNITGSVTGSTTATTLAYGGTANPTVVNVSGNFTGFATMGSNVAGSVAVYNQTAGTVTVTPGVSVGTQVAGAAGYGYFSLTGTAVYKASTTVQRFDVTAGNSTGVVYIGGNSTLNFAGGEHFLVAFNGASAIGEITIADNGLVDHSNATKDLQVLWTTSGEYGVVNMAGGTFNNTGKQIIFGGGAANNQVGIVNLAAGTMIATGFASNTSTGTGNKSFINFAGGTYKASAAQTLVGADSTGNIMTTTMFGAIDNSAIGGPSFLGGLTIDTNGFVVTSNRPIAGTTGTFGVTQTNLAIPGSALGNANYVGAPAVQFSAPAAGGVPAAGYALISGGVVTGLVITDPGTYANGETPTVTLTGGGGTIAPFAITGLTTGNLDGGLTVIGTGSVLLSAANTYGGSTTVQQGGTLKIGNANAIPATLTLGSTGTIGTLDLNGLATNVTGVLVGSGATAGSQIVTNSSTTALGTLILNIPGTATLPAIQINDGGTQKTALAITGSGSLTQTNTYAFTGGTAIQNGSLRIAGSDNRLNATGAVTLGNLATSGKLILGGDGVGGTGVGTQRNQTLNQTSATSILSTSGTGLFNSVIGGSDGGTSAGTPVNNSVLTLNIGGGFTDTYAGLIGWDGQGAIGFQNNLNLVKTGAGNLNLTGDLSKWTGIGSGPNNPTRPTLTVQAGSLGLGGVINTIVLNSNAVINDLGYALGPNGSINMTGGLITLSDATDTFAGAGLSSTSHGVVALNSDNTGLVGLANSDMYLGAVGIRTYSGTTLAPGLNNTYRLGGGAPLNALGSAAPGTGGGYLIVATPNVLTGAGNQVLVGDNTNTILGGLSTVEFTAPQNFGGALTIQSGSLQFTADNQLGGQAVAANSVLLDGGALNHGFNAILRYGPNTTFDVTPRLGILSGGTLDVGANNVTVATAIGNAPGGTGGLNKIGTGTLTLTTPTTYAGPTAVSQGALVLDLNALGGNDVISPTSAGLILAGGNLTVKGTGGGTAARSQTFNNGTTFASGNSTITPAFNITGGTPSLTIALGALSRNAGATANVSYLATNFVTTANAVITQNGIATPGTLISANGAAYMTFGTSATSIRDWAVTDATTPSKIVQAPAAFYNTTWAGAPTAAPANSNFDIGNTSPTFTPTVAGDNPISTIRFDNNSGSHTVSLNTFGTGATYSIGGVLVTSTVTNNTMMIGGTGVLLGANGGTSDFLIHNWNAAYLTAAGVASSNSNAYFKATAVIGGSGGVTYAGSPQALSWASALNTYPGVTTVNGSFAYVAASVSAGVAGQFGTASADATNFVLNGGGLYDNQTSGTITFGRLFSLGLNGGTLQSEANGAFVFNGLSNGSNAIGFLGAGARTLTLTGSGVGANSLSVSLGDSGGPSSLLKTGTGLWTLGVANSYTGATMISSGALRLALPGALPGGVGVLGGPVTSTTSGGGPLVFNGTGTSNAVLELTAGSGNFYRSAGLGADQVQWNGNGGFSAAGADMTVNLGGNTTPSGLVWGSTPGFVSTGNLILGSATATNKVIFQNPLDLNGANRTVQVDNGTVVIEAELAGALSNGSGTAAGFVKSGAGVLLLSGVNNAGSINTSVTGELLLFANASAIPGADGTRSVTVGPNGTIVLPGATDLSALLSRLNAASTGVVSLDASGSAPIDLSDPALANVYLGAYSVPGGTPIYYNGTITPGASNTYKFANFAQASPGTATAGIGQPVNFLVLNGTNMLADGAAPRSVILGGNSTAQGGTGSIYISGYNTYTNGTTIGQATGAAGTNTEIGLGNDAALGTGLITLNDGRIGALNGDHTLSNNLKTTGTTGNVAVGGGATSDFIVNSGGLTYLGASDFSSLTSGGLFTRTAANPAIFLGDVKTSTAGNLNMIVASDLEFLTTPAGAVAKTLSGATATTRGFTWSSSGGSSAGALVIDSATSLGAVPTASNATFFNLGGVNFATLEVLPGITAPVVLSPNQGLTTSSGANFAFTVNGAPTINDSTNAPTSGLIGNSTLVFPGVISGTSTGAPGFNKLGYGTLTLQGKNTTIVTTGGFGIYAGTLKLDFANSAGTDPIFTVTTLPLTLSGALSTNTGTASTLASGGVTLALVGKSGQINNQSFGNVSNGARDNNLTIDDNGGTVNLVLGVITNTLGGTLAVTPSASGTITITNTNTVSTKGLLVDAGANPYVIVGGTDWGALSGSNLVSGSTVATFYNQATTLVATTNADIVAASNLSANTSVTSVRFNTAAPLALSLGASNLVTGGILMGTGAGANNQVISGTGTVQGTQVGGAGKNLAIYQADPAAALTISAVIANNTAATTTPATALSKAGPGTLILSGTNTYTGVTYFNGGAISVGAVTNGAAAGPLGASANAAANWVFTGGTLQFTGATATGTTDHGATFTSVSAIDVTQAGTTLTLTNSTSNITGVANTPGILRKIGPGALTIAGTTGNNTNLSVEVAAGTLNLGKTGAGVAVQQANGAALIVDAGATARVTGTAATQIGSTSSVLIKAGGQFDLNGVNLSFDGLAGGGLVTSATGTPTLTLGSANDAAISAYTIGATAAGLTSTGLNNFGGSLSGTIALTKNGAGTQIMSGVSTYSGATTINAGTLKMGAANALPSGAGQGDVTIAGNLVLAGLIVPGALDLGGYDLAINGLNSTTGGVVVNAPTVAFTTAWGTPYGTAATSGTSTLSVGNGDASGAFNGVLQDGFSVLPGAVTGTGVNGLLALDKVGAGTQVLSGANTYSGGTTIDGGTVQINSAASLGAITSTATINAGTLQVTADIATTRNFKLGAATSTVSVDPGVTYSVSGNFTDGASAGTLNKAGAGTMVLLGTDSHGGATNITGGTLQVGNGGTAGTLASGAINISAGAALAINHSDSVTVASAIGGAGNFVQSGGGTTILTGANNYGGTTAINSGTLQVGNGGITGALGSGAVTNNATLSFLRSDPSTVTAAIGGTGTINQGSGVLSLNGAVTGQNLHVTGGQVNLGTGDSTPANPNHSLSALTIDSGTSVKLTLGGSQLVKAASLTVAGTGRLDLGKNAFVLDYAPGGDAAALNSVMGLLQTGFDGGLWDGAGGITTSAVADGLAADPTHYQYLTAIGYMPGALMGSSFLGRPVDTSSVLLRYTYYGDANLDGVVNGADYALIDSAYAALHDADPNNNPVVSWVNGDFNYDGKIDGADYALMDTAAAFSSGTPLAVESSAALIETHEEQLGAAYTAELASLPAAVPEPASFGMLMLGGAILGLRRRRAK